MCVVYSVLMQYCRLLCPVIFGIFVQMGCSSQNSRLKLSPAMSGNFSFPNNLWMRIYKKQSLSLGLHLKLLLKWTSMFHLYDVKYSVLANCIKKNSKVHMKFSWNFQWEEIKQIVLNFTMSSVTKYKKTSLKNKEEKKRLKVSVFSLKLSLFINKTVIR